MPGKISASDSSAAKPSAGRGYNNFQRGEYHARGGYYRGNNGIYQNVPRNGRPNPRQTQLSSQQKPGTSQPQCNPYKYYAPKTVVKKHAPMADTDTKPASMLSPHAREFIPSSFMTMRLNSSKSLDEPQAQMQSPVQHQCRSRQVHRARVSHDEEVDAASQLRKFITDVTLSPGLFHNKIDDIVNVMLEEICIRRNPAATLVEIIFEAGVLQQNFRYSGANLCFTASDKVRTPDGGAVFQSSLLHHMYESLAEVEPVVGDKEGDKITRGTVLFCAEIFSKLDLGFKLDISGSYPDMGVILCSTIKQLILCNEKENQKGGIQALKLCGASLEKLCEKTDAIDDLMAHCKSLEDQEGVDSTIQFMLSRLPQLREANWNRAEETSMPCPNKGSEDYNQSPVMYGPDGQPMNEEELDFLGDMDQFPVEEFYEAPPELPCMDEDEGEEAFDAFEDFLRETGQI